MCEIQFISKQKGTLTDSDLNELVKMGEFGSIDNYNAYGFFSENHIFKKAGMFEKESFNGFDFSPDHFMVIHNRYSTSGNAEYNENNHPFMLNDLIMVHNGVINNFRELQKEFNLDSSEIKTDSYVILQLINKFLTESQNQNRENAVLESIKKTCELLTGYFSIFLYDKLFNQLYYFKNDKASFYFLKCKNTLIGTTCERKLKYIYESEKKTELKFKSNRVYLIKNNQLVKGIKFKQKSSSTDYGGFTYSNGVYSNLSFGDFSYKTEKESIFELDEDINDLDKERKVNFIEDFFYNNFEFIPDYEFKNDRIYIKNESDVLTILDYMPDIFEYSKDSIKPYIYFDSLYYYDYN